MIRALIPLLLAAPLAGCSHSKPPPVDEQQHTPAQKTVFDTQIKALEKAKGVQKTVDDQKAATDKKLEDEGG